MAVFAAPSSETYDNAVMPARLGGVAVASVRRYPSGQAGAAQRRRVDARVAERRARVGEQVQDPERCPGDKPLLLLDEDQGEGRARRMLTLPNGSIPPERGREGAGVTGNSPGAAYIVFPIGNWCSEAMALELPVLQTRRGRNADAKGHRDRAIY